MVCTNAVINNSASENAPLWNANSTVYKNDVVTQVRTAIRTKEWKVNTAILGDDDV